MGRTTNKARREKQAGTAREKAAIARAEQQRAEQRRRAMVILSSVVAVVVVIVAVAAIAITHKGSNSASGNRVAASASVLNDVNSVSPATFQTVAGGTDTLLPKKTNGDPPLTSGGKPQVLFIGAEFCPFCAAERWPLIESLRQFGTFSNLKQVSSSSTDTDPNTPTFSFYKSGYTSKYLSFAPVEDEDRSGNSLENPTSAQNKLWLKYTGSPPNGPQFPFIDYGGKFVQTSQSFDPSILAGMTQAQVAAQLNDPTSPVAKAIDGAANMTTATICTLTNNQPAKVCFAPAINALQSKLGA